MGERARLFVCCAAAWRGPRRPRPAGLPNQDHCGFWPLGLDAPAAWRIPQIMDGDKYLWQALGSGVWPIMVLVSEIVQTFILADFW